MSISCGVTGYVAGNTMDTVMARADKALYQAKHGGGNQVVLLDEAD